MGKGLGVGTSRIQFESIMNQLPALVACKDVLYFQDVMKKMRLIDDRISHELNKKIPTQSFSSSIDATSTCKSLYDELLLAHQQRDDTINNCIRTTQTSLEDLKKQKELNSDDTALNLNIKKEKNELLIEQIVKERSNKLFSERCRLYYIPEDMSI